MEHKSHNVSARAHAVFFSFESFLSFSCLRTLTIIAPKITYVIIRLVSALSILLVCAPGTNAWNPFGGENEAAKGRRICADWAMRRLLKIV